MEKNWRELIGEIREELETKERIIKEKKEEIATLESVIETKDKTIEMKEEIIKAREMEVQTLSNTLESKEHTITKLKNIRGIRNIQVEEETPGVVIQDVTTHPMEISYQYDEDVVEINTSDVDSGITTLEGIPVPNIID